ncbi:DNA polymerase III subunit delta [Aestuariirhabdus litorea]|uniref:DNA polymerase III subunit delta n=1 Tax=Aestuariirhabdus litorea TaxID=2528527 RepID=A0A3P3VMB8_9GAMM|nr:DNA polymerase III subunit delta [Aestuariirhabdus litorea]RRJ83574.1 DNA polymerase III subunit delta [Aestuariirhabdus litorea]RWW96795.1 DNA polymerase III subunit delta [Endozoicomonadaceae bacterium GTF-13]
MKLRAEQLASHLKKGLAPLYIVSGDDPLQLQECCDSIRLAAREQGVSERELMHADGGFDWNDLLQSANSLSLFADRKLIELRIANGKPGDKGSKALTHYAENASPDNVLLLVLPKMDAAAQRSKWFKMLEQAGVLIQLWPIDAAALPGWIQKRLAAAGLAASPDAVQLLADRVEGNLLAAQQEIEKLRLLATGERVEVDTINAVVSDSARFDIFSLVDSALTGDAIHSARMLSGLRAEGSEPTVILWALTRELRSLGSMARLLQQGQAVEQVLKSQRVWEKRKAPVRRALTRLSEREWRMMLQHAARIDRTIKGMETGNVWDELSALCLRLAGLRTPAADY